MWTFLCAAAAAETHEIGDEDALWEVLSSLSAGDTVFVLPGTYAVPTGEDLDLHWGGAEDALITIQAEPGTVTLLGEGGRNVLNLSGQHYTFSGFTLTGGSKGLRLYEGVGIELSDLLLYDLGSTGITLNDAHTTYTDVTIARVEIADAAGCVIVGCDDGACTAEGVAVTNTHCHYTGAARGAGLSFFASTDTTVLRNVVADTDHPGIQIFGPEDAFHAVEGNLVLRAADNGIQATSGARLINNVVIDAGNYGIELKGSEVALGAGEVLHNTVLGAAQACLKIDQPLSEDVLIANNALLCPDSVALQLYKADAATFTHNAFLGTVPATLPDAFLVDEGATDAVGWLPEDSPLIDAGGVTAVSEDFRCTPRDALPDIGAFEWRADVSPWILPEGIPDPCGEAGDTADFPEAPGALSGGACACSSPAAPVGAVWPWLLVLLGGSRRRAVVLSAPE